ncbi:Porin D precursor [compost metagenome]
MCQPAYGDGGRHWERDFDLRYVVQAGPAKDLAVSFSQVSHRANDAQGGADIDRIYVIVEYPLKGVF